MRTTSDLISLDVTFCRLISCCTYNFLARSEGQQGFGAISSNSLGTLRGSGNSNIVVLVFSLCLQLFQRLKGQKIAVPTV